MSGAVGAGRSPPASPPSTKIGYTLCMPLLRGEQREPRMTSVFQRLYFDSSVLIGAKWPIGSAQLNTLATLARDVDVELFLPEPVAQELEAHWIRKFCEVCSQARSRVDKIAEWIFPVSVEFPALTLPDEAAVRADYRRAAEGLQEKLNLKSSPATTRPTAHFFDLAVRHHPPFGEQGRGFQDAVILFSVIDHLRAAEGVVAGLLTSDEMLGHPESLGLAREAGVVIEGFNKMEQVMALLTGRLRVARRERWEQDCQAAEAALTAARQQIQDFVAENLSVSERDLGLWSRLVTVRELQIERLLSVRTPFPPERVEGQEVPINFDLEVLISALVERPLFDLRALRPPPRIRKGEIAPRSILGEIFGSTGSTMFGSTGDQELIEQPVRTIVEVEASAIFRDGRYTDLTLREVRIKPTTGLSAALLSPYFPPSIGQGGGATGETGSPEVR